MIHVRNRFRLSISFLAFALPFALFMVVTERTAQAQSAFNSGSVTGAVTDQTGALIPGAVVTITNPVSGVTRTQTSDGNGNFAIRDVPFNHYHMTVASTGFDTYTQDIE